MKPSEQCARDYLLAERRFTEAFDRCPEKPSLLLELAQAQVSVGQELRGRDSNFQALPGDRSRFDRRTFGPANAYLMALRLKEALAEADSILRDHPLESPALKIKGERRVSAG